MYWCIDVKKNRVQVQVLPSTSTPTCTCTCTVDSYILQISHPTTRWLLYIPVPPSRSNCCSYVWLIRYSQWNALQPTSENTTSESSTNQKGVGLLIRQKEILTDISWITVNYLQTSKDAVPLEILPESQLPSSSPLIPPDKQMHIVYTSR